MNLKPIFFAALLFSAPASQLSALPSTVIVIAEESLTDATAQRVLDEAAPQFGESSTSLMSQYRAGTVSITDLGPVRGGNRYEVSRGNNIIIVDIIDM